MRKSDTKNAPQPKAATHTNPKKLPSLFGGLGLGKAGDLLDFFYRAALEKQVDALESLEYAAFLGCRGAAAFETVVL